MIVFDRGRRKLNDMEEEFVNYLASIWHGRFHHAYPITRSFRWKEWRDRTGNAVTARWSCTSLREADEHYSWTSSAETRPFEDLSRDLMAAIDADNEQAARRICREIFVWGGVGSRVNDPSRVWVEQLTIGTLIRKLKEGTGALLGQNAPLDAFDGTNALMNSAMTKVYAACCPDQLVIYDGRVGAALGLIARDFLTANGLPGPVPPEIAFAWGAARTAGVTRNPSQGQFVFPRLFGTRGDARHARLMWQASRLLRAAIAEINMQARTDGTPVVTLRKLERALFMVGYDVGQAS
jgi:hypothetical protein